MKAEPQVFAMDGDDGSLHAFASFGQATASCKGVDVADGFWRFFADDGSPLDPLWDGLAAPADGTSFSDYNLERAMSGLWLQERLPQVTSVSGCGLATVGEVVEILKINRSRRIQLDSARG